MLEKRYKYKKSSNGIVTFIIASPSLCKTGRERPEMAARIRLYQPVDFPGVGQIIMKFIIHVVVIS